MVGNSRAHLATADTDARRLLPPSAPPLAREGALAAVPLREGRRGNPVLLGRGLFEAAMSLTGDEGARRLIGALSAAELVEVEAPDMSVTHDIDTPDDLAAARRSRGGS